MRADPLPGASAAPATTEAATSSVGEEDSGTVAAAMSSPKRRHEHQPDSHNVLRRVLTTLPECKQIDDMTSDAIYAHAALLLRSTGDVQCLLSCVPLLTAALQQGGPGSSEAERGFFDAARIALEVASKHLPEACLPAAEDAVSPNEADVLSFDAALGAIGLDLGAIGLDPGSFDGMIPGHTKTFDEGQEELDQTFGFEETIGGGPNEVDEPHDAAAAAESQAESEAAAHDAAAAAESQAVSEAAAQLRALGTRRGASRTLQAREPCPLCLSAFCGRTAGSRCRIRAVESLVQRGWHGRQNGDSCPEAGEARRTVHMLLRVFAEGGVEEDLVSGGEEDSLSSPALSRMRLQNAAGAGSIGVALHVELVHRAASEALALAQAEGQDSTHAAKVGAVCAAAISALKRCKALKASGLAGGASSTKDIKQDAIAALSGRCGVVEGPEVRLGRSQVRCQNQAEKGEGGASVCGVRQRRDGEGATPRETVFNCTQCRGFYVQGQHVPGSRRCMDIQRQARKPSLCEGGCGTDMSNPHSRHRAWSLRCLALKRARESEQCREGLPPEEVAEEDGEGAPADGAPTAQAAPAPAPRCSLCCRPKAVATKGCCQKLGSRTCVAAYFASKREAAQQARDPSSEGGEDSGRTRHSCLGIGRPGGHESAPPQTGRHVILFGGPGSGKTTVSRRVVEHERAALGSSARVAIVAAFGVLAKDVGGQTLHSWAGLTPKSGVDVDSMEFEVREHRAAVRRWEKVVVLVMTDAAVISAEFFDALELLARRIRNRDAFFGGITLVIDVDFQQLPPVSTGEAPRKPLYESGWWCMLRDQSLCVGLVGQKRFGGDERLLRLVSNVRRGGPLSADDTTLLGTELQRGLELPEGVKPVHLFPRKEKVLGASPCAP